VTLVRHDDLVFLEGGEDVSVSCSPLPTLRSLCRQGTIFASRSASCFERVSKSYDTIVISCLGVSLPPDIT